MVAAEDAEFPGNGVFVQFVRGLVVAECVQVAGEVSGGAKGMGMVCAENLAAAGEGVFVQVPGRLQVAEVAQVDSEVVSGDSVSGWFSPRTRRRRARVFSSSSRAAW